ncbi:MAG TPA: glycoside hydrolase family 2 TIM barrel-domain containing protein [Clostridia bacterium]|nr:glycoside hydrolase family 2 TIM barrel-domain containing protein [Clostridia bacterium]
MLSSAKNLRSAFLIAGLCGLCLPVMAGTLVTRWAADVCATNALPEYPRPQLVRDQWQNLNGEWDYQVTVNNETPPAAFDGKILVPFPIESHLSGVTKNLGEHSTLWYRRHFTIPEAWRGQSIQLHFGAVDWFAKVFVNGKLLGLHRGGYDAFSLDVTPVVEWGEENELIVAAMDPTEGDQPRGKQSRRVEGIFYTSSSGIWQTVWLEPVPPMANIRSLKLVPDVASQGLRVTVLANALSEDLSLELVASIGGQEVGRTTGSAGTEISLPLRVAKLWSPDQPHLYDLDVVLRQGGEVRDRVRSYFGLREVRVGSDESGVRRLFLNGEPLFQMGVLDQGFWPDGLYTAPSDEALRSDLQVAKKLGFNLVRKHVKVEPERWYYWADKLGLLVWQDMPSGNNFAESGRRQFEMELHRLLEQRGNHPSIIMWVLFNEGWGQFDTERLAQRIKRVDPTRLVNSASGWTDLKVGDVIDLHSYPHPLAPGAEPVRAGVLGEFGGLGLGVENHTWSTRQPWGYQLFPDAERLTSQYVSLLSKVWTLQRSHGLAAAVYTQLTDVESECNGFLTYDRAVLKMDAARVRRSTFQGPMILPDARRGAHNWSYTITSPNADWMQPEFDASSWGTGAGGFGTHLSPGVIVNTVWNAPDIWLRREFQLEGKVLPSSVWLSLYHDEDVEVYLNGVLALQAQNYITGYKDFELSGTARAALRPGKNIIAIHCRQTTGGQYVDAGLFATPGNPEVSAP